jgi:hypothetical protein
MPKPMERITHEDYQARIDRLMEIYEQISTRVTEVSLLRCPYKDRDNRCTAQFGCRNKRKPEPPDEKYACASDDKLDYRSAWESR